MTSQCPERSLYMRFGWPHSCDRRIPNAKVNNAESVFISWYPHDIIFSIFIATACPLGYFKARVDSSGCIPCARNMMTYSTASVSCVCVSGYYPDENGAGCTGVLLVQGRNKLGSILFVRWISPIFNSDIYKMKSQTQVVELIIPHTMMTSSNGNIFRVTGPLCG